jgi:hypothetical protein
MSLSDYIPNIISAPTGYEGLLGAEPTRKLEKQANLQGLLGVAASLAQGMSSQGPRRSALQNILGSLASGYGATQQAYQGGLQQYGAQQQIAQSNRAMALQKQKDAVMQKLQRGEQLTPNDLVILNPEEATKVQFQKMRMADLYQTTPQGEQKQQFTQPSARDQFAMLSGVTPAAALYPVEVTPNKSAIQQQIDMYRQANAKAATTLGGIEAKEIIDNNNKLIKDLLSQQESESVITYDLKDLENSVNPQLKPYVAQLQALKADGKLTTDQLRSGIENILSKNIEVSKASQFANETAKDYAMSMFETSDITKLQPWQRENVLAYGNAPSDKDRASIRLEAIKVKRETGIGIPDLRSRTDLLSEVKPTGVKKAGTGQSVAGQGQGQAASEVPAVAPSAVKKAKLVPLVEQSDARVPLKTKQDLIADQPVAIRMTRYGLKQVAEQKAAAEELLNNPAYIKAITAKGLLPGMFTEYLSGKAGETAYNAANLLNQLRTKSFVAELSEMRSTSKTGAGVGAVNEKELEGLSNLGAVLKVGMSEKELRNQLRKYIDRANNSVKYISDDYSRTYPYQGEFDEYLGGGGLPAGVTVEVVK